ncbi:hypothetical protein JL722_4608 [Aureococcus anophagefferens]|nr:hypothetical protein JL722_4608 [Aureococcus anophagefferens]
MVVKQRKNLLVENVVDPASGEVLEEFRLPPWWPKRLRPPRRLARGVSNAELALAGFAAGGLTEIARVAALHPLSTVKTRSQGNFEGDDIFADLYAGAGPSIAAAAPAAATYYLLSGAESSIGDARRRTAVPDARRDGGALLAPAIGRRRAAGRRVPAERPGRRRRLGADRGRRRVAALATTPLGVARTRALATASNERAPGVVGALRGIAATEGGDALFAGAAARVLYNGIVVAAVIPLRSLFYTGLRDALILDGVFEFDA